VKEAYEKKKLADLKYSEAEQLLYKELGIEKLELTREKTFETTFFEIEKTMRFDSEYYQLKYDQNIENVRNSKFKNVKLGTLIEGIKYGTSEKVDYSESGIPFLRVTDINSFNTIDIEDIKRIPEYELPRVKNAIIREREVLISRTGTIGCAVYIDGGLKNSVFGSYFIKIKVDESKINPLYLSIFLNSQLGRLQTERDTSGAIQTNITLPIIKSLRIIVPDTEIQDKICDVYMDALQIRNASRKHLLEIEKHNQAIISFSLNTPENAERWEIGTAPVAKRIEAAKAICDAGYETRIRIDPMIPFPESKWEEDYKELIDQIFSKFTPERP